MRKTLTGLNNTKSETPTLGVLNFMEASVYTLNSKLLAPRSLSLQGLENMQMPMAHARCPVWDCSPPKVDRIWL